VRARNVSGEGPNSNAEFFALLIDLMHGDLSSLDRIDAGSSSATRPAAAHVLVEESRRAGEVALAAMPGQPGHAFSSSWSPRLDDKGDRNCPARWPCV